MTGCDELTDLEHYETLESNTSAIADFEEHWLPELNLTLKDRNVITKIEWLSDKHMLAVSNLLKQLFPQINGLQDTKNTPFFVDEKQFWNTNKRFEQQKSLCVQLHFEGNAALQKIFHQRSRIFPDYSKYKMDS